MSYSTDQMARTYTGRRVEVLNLRERTVGNDTGRIQRVRFNRNDHEWFFIVKMDSTRRNRYVPLLDVLNFLD